MSASAFRAAGGRLSSPGAPLFESPSTSTTLNPCGRTRSPLSGGATFTGGCAEATADVISAAANSAERKTLVELMACPSRIEIGIEDPDDPRAARRRELQ